jgi:hypothetical protein
MLTVTIALLLAIATHASAQTRTYGGGNSYQTYTPPRSTVTPQGTYQTFGNQTYGPNGYNSQTLGDTTYIRPGYSQPTVTCQTIGNTVYCR